MNGRFERSVDRADRPPHRASRRPDGLDGVVDGAGRWAGRLGRWGERLGQRVHSAFSGRWRWVLLLALLGLAWPLVAERGFIVQADYPGWAAIIDMLDREVLPQCHWFWGVPFPRVNAGEILGQPYSLSIIVPWLLAKIVPIEWALKLVILGSFLTLGFGFYCFMAPKSSRFAACLGGYLCVLENLWHINFGMWYNSLSIGLALFFFAALGRFVENRRTGAWVAAVLLLALTVFTHPLGTVMALTGWLGLFVFQLIRHGRSDLRRVLLVLSVPVLAVGIALPQILATVVGNPVGGERFTALHYNPFTLLGQCLSRSILLVALYGLAGALRKREQLLWMILPPLLLAPILYRNWLLAIPFTFPFKAGLVGFAYRFTLIASAAALVLFALGIARVQAALQTGRGAYRPLARWILGLIVLGAALLGLEQTFSYQAKTLLGEYALKDHGDFMAVCDWIEKNVDHQTERVYVEDTYERRDFPLFPANRAGHFLLRTLHKNVMQFTHYMSLLSLRTGCQQVNGFALYQNSFNKQHCCNGQRLFDIRPEDLTPRTLREQLWMLNCRHIVVFSDSMRELLGAMRFLQCSCRFGRFCVFTWSDMPPHYAWSGGADPQPIPVTRLSAVRCEVDLRGTRAATVYLSMQYHASWKAYLDGRPVPVMPWRGLVSVPLPPGTGGTLLVCYELRRVGPLVVASASMLAMGAVALARHLRGAGNVLSGPGRAPGGARAARLRETAIS